MQMPSTLTWQLVTDQTALVQMSKLNHQYLEIAPKDQDLVMVMVTENLNLTAVWEEQCLEAALKYQDLETTIKINPCRQKRPLKHLRTRKSVTTL
ncbi:hypothetical protein ACTXT7_016834 [Hymenolepis weldensis]